jgi:hypothetical protein
MSLLVIAGFNPHSPPKNTSKTISWNPCRFQEHRNCPMKPSSFGKFIHLIKKKYQVILMPETIRFLPDTRCRPSSMRKDGLFTLSPNVCKQNSALFVEASVPKHSVQFNHTHALSMLKHVTYEPVVVICYFLIDLTSYI